MFRNETQGPSLVPFLGSRTCSSSRMRLALFFFAACASVPLPVPSAWKSDTIRFSGRRWHVRESSTPVGAGPSRWSASGARVHGASLELRSGNVDGHPSGVELASSVLSWPIDISVALGELPRVDEYTVIGVFLYENDRCEVDVEFAQWGDSESAPAQFAASLEGGLMVRRFSAPRGPFTIRFRWDDESLQVWLKGEERTRHWRIPTALAERRPRMRLHLNVWRMPRGPEAPPVSLEVRSVR